MINVNGRWFENNEDATKYVGSKEYIRDSRTIKRQRRVSGLMEIIGWGVSTIAFEIAVLCSAGYLITNFIPEETRERVEQQKMQIIERSSGSGTYLRI